MYDNPIFQSEKVQDTSNVRSPQTTGVEQSWLYDKATPPIGLKLASSTLILVPFGLIVLWSIALVWFNLQKKRHHSISKGFGHKHHDVPCRRCAFFKSNPYLKCAINPLDALTMNAIDCPDYTPKSPQE